MTDVYETEPLPGQSVLYHRINAKSETAAIAAGEDRLSFDTRKVNLHPAERLSSFSLRRRHAADDVVGFVRFEPKIEHGKPLRWSVNYKNPGTFDPLREMGEDTIALAPSRETTDIRVVIDFPMSWRGVGCTASTEGALPTPNQPAEDVGDPGTIRWVWESRYDASQPRPNGRYVLTLRRQT